MPTVTITGASGVNVVSFINVTTATTAAIAQAAADSISTLFAPPALADQNVNTGYTGGTQIVGSIGGNSQGSYGTLNPSLNSNVVALTINNSDTTTTSNARFMGGETVLSGTGNLNFTDNASSTYIVAGGGTNSITFSRFSSNGTFIGDGANTINVTAGGATSIFGTASSSDTIVGGSGSKIVYTSGSGATAFINPNNSNVTVFGAGGIGSTTVFGGLNTPGTGTLTVTDGRGLFQGGTGGPNIMGSSSVGGTTLIGGASGDVLSSKGVGDSLKGGLGISTLDASYSRGNVTLSGGINGASLIYASQSLGDTINTTSSAYNAGAFTGEFVQLHTGPNSLFRSLNNSVSSTIVGGGGAGNSGPQFATMGDFISGLDKLVLVSSVVGSIYGLVTGSIGSTVYTNVGTSNGSTFTFYNTILTANDIKVV